MSSLSQLIHTLTKKRAVNQQTVSKMHTPPASTAIVALNLLKIMVCAAECHAWSQMQTSFASETSKSKGLKSLCAHVAAELHDKLTRQGLESVIHVLEDRQANFQHCYVAVGNLVVDVTASQFQSGMAPIVIIDRGTIDIKKAPWWALGASIEDRDELIQYLSARGWPAEQIPKKVLL